jgi:alkaline phosphatase D
MQTTSDWAGFISERTEILDLVRDRGITGFGAVCGDRHAFFAGLLAPVLPPKGFDPVGFEFVTGSLSSVGQGLVMPRIIPKDHPLRPAYVYDPPNGRAPRSAVDFTVLHGYRSSFVLQETHDRAKALAVRNPELSPHLKFVDGGGHGYGLVTCGKDALTCEFVCIPDPNERSETPDGGPLLYRVTHRVPLWKAGEPPRLEQTVLEGDVGFHT